MTISNAARNLSDQDIEVPRALVTNVSATTARSVAERLSRPLLDFEAFSRAYAPGQRGTPPWQASVVSKLCQYVQLSPGWDGYRGQPVKLDNAIFALVVLSGVMGSTTPIPEVVPTSAGGIQIEWHENGLDLEFHITSPYESELWYHDHRTGMTGTARLEEDLSALAGKVERLSTVL